MTDTKFNALYPQREHAPGPGPLSPAAQAVMDAAYAGNAEGDVIGAAAAILRACADQVAPERDCPDTEEWLGQSAWAQAESGVRLRLLAIAAELEGHHG